MFLTGLLAGLALVAVQVPFIVWFAARHPEPPWLALLPAAVCAAAFLFLLARFDDALGLLTGQLVLVAFAPEIAEAARRGGPAPRRRAVLVVVRLVQALAAGCALYAWFELGDPAAAVPMVLAALLFERTARYASSLPG